MIKYSNRNDATIHLIVSHIVKGLRLPEGIKDFLLMARIKMCGTPEMVQITVTKLFQKNVPVLKREDKKP